jgi:proteasome lid subunit RPN8/RPN11
MIYIEPQAEVLLLSDARLTYPDECCGFFFGTESGENRTVTHIMVVDNSKEGDKRRRFAISPKDYLRAERYADEHRVQLLGVYHSHPDHPAVPSEHDRVAAQPYFSYVIVSVVQRQVADIRSWVLNDQIQFEEEQVRIVNSSLITHI